jgi:hypothetical protein
MSEVFVAVLSIFANIICIEYFDCSEIYESFSVLEQDIERETMHRLRLVIAGDAKPAATINYAELLTGLDNIRTRVALILDRFQQAGTS